MTKPPKQREIMRSSGYLMVPVIARLAGISDKTIYNFLAAHPDLPTHRAGRTVYVLAHPFVDSYTTSPELREAILKGLTEEEDNEEGDAQ